MYLGAHMSIAGGMPKAVERAGSVDATALQVFVKSSNQWAARPFEDGEAESFRSACADAGIHEHTIAHSSYLINLGTPKDALWRKSKDALCIELDRCAALGISGLVLHPGSHVGSGEEAGLARVAAALEEVMDRTDGKVEVLLENTAGQGSNMGYCFEHLATIIDRAACADHLGVCFDTCHALAAGYEQRNRKSYTATFDEFDRIIGLERLKAFHLNDSKADLGSRKDRHEHIGKGFLGLEPFRFLVNDDRFKELPLVLETPKGEDLAEDRENMAVLRGLVES